MKKWIATNIFILICSFLAYAQEGKVVAVTAEKEVEIKDKDVATARVLALTLAARDAVEKGYGTYVKVEELPDARQILARSAASLQYHILAEQQRGNKYWVKIQASVIVPAEYVSEKGEEREGLGDKMKNFVQKYPQGEINWGDGIILAYGKGEITDTKSSDPEELAARAAETDARAHLLEIINDIPVDDRSKVGQDPRMTFALEGFVKDSAVVARSKSGTTVNVTVEAPLRGVRGLTMTIYGVYTPPPPPPPAEVKPLEPVAVPEAEKFTGIVIDARKSAANPVLFPKVQDTKKREVYTVKQVNQDDLQKRGMASYAVVARDVQISRLFPHAMVLPVAYVPGENTPQTASGKSIRQGTHPLVLVVSREAGKENPDLIISEEDAAKIQAIDASTNALKECRVVIVVSSD